MDEHIQFLNYILSLSSVLLAGAALWIVLTDSKERDEEIQDLRERINTVAKSATAGGTSNNNNKKR